MLVDSLLEEERFRVKGLAQWTGDSFVSLNCFLSLHLPFFCARLVYWTVTDRLRGACLVVERAEDQQLTIAKHFLLILNYPLGWIWILFKVRNIYQICLHWPRGRRHFRHILAQTSLTSHQSGNGSALIHFANVYLSTDVCIKYFVILLEICMSVIFYRSTF